MTPIFFATLLAQAALQAAPETQVPVLLIVMDGLRPDYVTPERMPALFALARDGVWGEHHRSVFRSMTRVNSASISTGAYPGGHGLMGNSVYVPAADPAKRLNTSDAKNLMLIDEKTGGRLLTATTLAEHLQSNGLRFLVISSGSTGTTFLQNPKVCGMGLIHPDLILPEALDKQVRDAAPLTNLGPLGTTGWVFDVYLKIALAERPDVTVLWLNEPDHVAHAKGVGAPETFEKIRLVDKGLAAIRETHRKQGIDANIIVVSDHGFTSRAGGIEELDALLVKEGLKENANSTDVVVVENSIYLAESAKERAPRIVELLRPRPWVGAIFTPGNAPDATEGALPGTLALELIQYRHERAPDILVDYRWTADANAFGFPGTAVDDGVAGHGSLCPWDMHATFAAAGPAFKKGLRNTAPSCNVDVAPTICRLLGLSSPASMQGRVIAEVLAGEPEPAALAVDKAAFDAPEFVLHTSGVLGHRYIDGAERRDGAKRRDAAK